MSENKTDIKKKRSLFDTATLSGTGTSRRVVKNAISKSFGALAEKFVYTSTRAYGAMSLSFGLLSLFIYLGKAYILTEANLSLSGLVIGLIFSVLSIFLLPFEKPLCIALQDFPVTDYIFFDFFSIKRVDKDDKKHGISTFSATLVGFIPALFSVFVNELYVLLGIAVLLFIAISFVTPEFTIVSTVLIAPYLSPIPDKGFTLAFLAILSAISFITKLIIGKRYFHLEIYDVAFLLLAVFIMVSGIITKTPLSAFIMLSLTLGYALSSNLITNRRLADCVVNAMTVSAVPLNISALIHHISAFARGESFTGATVFASRDSYGAFLFITAIFSAYYAFDAKSKLARALYTVPALLSLINILLAWQPGLIITLLFTVMAYFIINRPKLRKEWLILLLALPYVLFILPGSVLDKVSEFLRFPSSLYEVLLSWQEGVNLISGNILFGIGVNGAAPIMNTFISLALSSGIFTLAIFTAVFLIRLVHLSSYAQYMKNSDFATVAKAGALATFALFSLGMTSDIFSDITLYYLFASIFGIVSAGLRLAKNEHDERVGYYGTTRSEDSSDVNVRISV